MKATGFYHAPHVIMGNWGFSVAEGSHSKSQSSVFVKYNGAASFLYNRATTTCRRLPNPQFSSFSSFLAIVTAGRQFPF